MQHAGIALRTFLIPVTSSRGLKIGILGLLGVLALAGLAVLLKPIAAFFASESLLTLRRMVIVPGLPLLAVLYSEMPLRDGIRHRTLLYPLLGPVPRVTLAWVRTAATAGLLAAMLSVVLVVVTLLQGSGYGDLPQEILAVWLGSAAYVALFGVIHLIARRGLIASLAFFLMLDAPLAKLPFALRVLSPAYHTGVIAKQTVEIELPIPLSPPESSVLVSSIVLAAMAVALTLLGALLFRRKSLGELC